MIGFWFYSIPSKETEKLLNLKETPRKEVFINKVVSIVIPMLSSQYSVNFALMDVGCLPLQCLRLVAVIVLSRSAYRTV